MKRFLLLCVATAMTLCTFAQKVERVPAELKKAAGMECPTVQVKGTKVLENKAMKGGVVLQKCQDESGMVYKRLLNTERVKAKTAPVRIKAGEDITTLAENFEGCTGEGWLPEGWKVESKAADNPNQWAVVKPFSIFGEPQNEGEYACEVQLSEQYCDEWLFTPAFDVSKDDQMVFLGLVDLFFMIDYNYLDFTTGEYSQKIPTAVLKIWATEDGENWTLVKDYFEEACSMTFDELMDDYMENGGLYAPRFVSLAAFEGKRIQLAFEYVGTNGNAVGIDNIGVGKPELLCEYDFPLWAPFYGISRQLMGLSLSIPVLPVYQPITWKGTYDDEAEDAFAYWIYYNADSEMDFAIGDELTVTYVTDYSSDFSARNNLFYPPTFNVSAEGWSDGSFSKYTYFQSGGRPDWENKGNLIKLGLSAYDPSAEGHTNATGPGGISIFGTGAGVDEFWTNQMKTDAYISSVSNLCYTPEYPIVFSDIYTQAKASGIKADAEYKIEILPVDEEGHVLPAIAESTINGSDAYVGLELTTDKYYTFEFHFDEPVVLDKENLGTDQYMIRWSGLHNSADELAPMQSYWESQKDFNHGFIWVEANGQSAILPINLFTQTKQGFGIMIDGWYPWLEAENTEVVIGTGESIAIPLDSYYPYHKLTLSVPEGLETEFAGLEYYPTRTATSGAAASDDIAPGAEHQLTLVITNKSMTNVADVKISAPGVEKTIKVTDSSVGIASTASDKAGVVKMYNMQGETVNPTTAPAGIYLYKMTDGTTKKVVKK